MSRHEDPLTEKPAKFLARCPANRLNQVGSVGGLGVMRDEIVVQGLKERLGLRSGVRGSLGAVEEVTQHIEDGGAFLVSDGVEHLHGVGEVEVNDGAEVIVALLGLFGELVVVNFEAIGVVTFMVLSVESGEIGGETLVEPDVGPVAALNVVSEPVLAQLVRDKAGAGIVLVGTLVVESEFGEGGGADVLLAAKDEIVDGGLSVLFEGVIDAGGEGEEGEHVGSEMEGAAGGGFVDVIGNEIFNGLAVIHVAEFSPGPDGEGDEIGAVGNGFHPVVGDLAGGASDAEEFSVGYDALAEGNGGDGFAGGHVVGVIPAREPKVIEFWFALGPDFARAARIAGIRIDEKEAGAGKAVVDDAELKSGGGIIIAIESDPEARVFEREGEAEGSGRGRLQGYGINIEPGAVEIKFSEMGGEGAKSDELVAENFAMGFVEMELEFVIFDVIGAGGRPLPEVRVAESMGIGGGGASRGGKSESEEEKGGGQGDPARAEYRRGVAVNNGESIRDGEHGHGLRDQRSGHFATSQGAREPMPAGRGGRARAKLSLTLE